jgi:redox-sensitive bicupin YhaK (pirin superfamily)
MAVMQSRDTRSFVAGESLAAAQFHFVTLENDGTVDLADADAENCIGVLLNAPASGEAATVAISGKVMVEAGGVIAAGAEVVTNTAGEAVTLTASSSATAVTMGYALEAAVDGQIMAIELIQGGNTSDQS